MKFTPNLLIRRLWFGGLFLKRNQSRDFFEWIIGLYGENLQSGRYKKGGTRFERGERGCTGIDDVTHNVFYALEQIKNWNI